MIKELITKSDNITNYRNDISFAKTYLEREEEDLKKLFHKTDLYILLKETYKDVIIDYIDEEDITLILDGEEFNLDNPETIFKEPNKIFKRINNG